LQQVGKFEQRDFWRTGILQWVLEPKHAIVMGVVSVTDVTDLCSVVIGETAILQWVLEVLETKPAVARTRVVDDRVTGLSGVAFGETTILQ
jgi:hypothetical protein